jgi:hypothetical protein
VNNLGGIRAKEVELAGALADVQGSEHFSLLTYRSVIQSI